MTKVKIEGLDDLTASLRAMGKLPSDDIKDALKLSANQMIMDAKSLAKWQRVRNAIGYINKRDKEYPNSVLIGVKWDGAGVRGKQNAIYYKQPRNNTGRFIIRESLTFWKLANILEYGSMPRKTTKGANRGVITASPYIRPAFDRNKQKALTDIKKNLIKIIEQQAKKNNLK